MTEKKHRSVILFGEWQRPLGALSLEQKGMLLDALLAYPEGKRPDFTDPMLRMAWTFMEGGLDENARKWEAVISAMPPTIRFAIPSPLLDVQLTKFPRE